MLQTFEEENAENGLFLSFFNDSATNMAQIITIFAAKLKETLQSI
jgi:hypothetical protein